ncbi:helix-turn-helix transcriptional regulator [Dactylosporangium sp. NPDC051485]|uniref:helix-turn-helix domain-containing protein n=1 Tax=Dactylosporangium sp. NPDC051485 TaxID=3154846 RepID=UPI00343A8524
MARHIGVVVMAPRPAALSPYASPRHFLGAELRSWRERRGLSLAELAGRVFVGASLLCKVEKAQRTATAELIGACDAVLDAGGVLVRLLAYAEHLAAEPALTPAPSASPPPVPQPPPVPEPRPVVVRLTIAAEIDGVPVVGDAADNGGGARVYSLAGRRRRRDER